MDRVVEIDGWKFHFFQQDVVLENGILEIVEDGSLTITSPDGATISLRDEEMYNHTAKCADSVGAYLEY